MIFGRTFGSIFGLTFGDEGTSGLLIRSIENYQATAGGSVEYSICEGDLSPSMEIPLAVNGVLENITDAVGDIVFHWRKPDGTVVDSTVDVLCAEAGLVLKQWVAGETDQVGSHFAQIIVTRGDGHEQTFPNGGAHYTWTVYPRL